MTQARVGRAAGLLAVILGLAIPSTGWAQFKISMPDGKAVSIGGGLRTAFRSTELFPDGETLEDITLESIRLYVSADVAPNIKVHFNTDYGQPDSTLRVLDALVTYSPSPYFNVWMGRHLPPSDRANLAGPFFANAYDYPGLVSRYPAIFAGRDNGILVNGQVDGGAFKYAGGVYAGAPNVVGEEDTLLYATRLVYSVLDPEGGYYNNGTYYGAMQLLTIGFAAQHQAGVVDLGTADAGSFTGLNVDVLYEQTLPSGGVVTIEAAAYDYDLDGAPGDGAAYLVTGAYLLPKAVGIGKFQPHVRYQTFGDESILDVGAHYVISGHNARVSAVVTRSGFDDFKTTQFTLGTQFQF